MQPKCKWILGQILLELPHLHGISAHRLAADIVPGRLESAKLVGADVTINCKEENLKGRGTPVTIILRI